MNKKALELPKISSKKRKSEICNHQTAVYLARKTAKLLALFFLFDEKSTNAHILLVEI